MLYLGVFFMFKWESEAGAKSVNYLFLITLSIFFVNFFSTSSIAETKKITDVVAVTVEHVKQDYFYDVVQDVGKIKAIDSAELVFNASAKLTKTYFHNGDKVIKGNLIAELDNTEAKTELDKSRSGLALAKTKLERINELLQREPYALSKQNVDEVRENVDLAKADFEQKLAAMKDYQIVAPFDGQLTSFNQSIGSHIAADSVLITLYKLNPVEVYYAISQNDFGKAKKGQQVSVTVEAYKDRVFKGKVNYVAPAVDEQSGRVAIRAELSNPGFALAPGMFANIKQYFGHRISRILVPQNSVIANNNERFVWLVKLNRVIKKVVTLGDNTNNGYVVITDGLEKDDLVVKTGMQNLKSDSIIRILPEDDTVNEKIKTDANSKSGAQ
ncbi:MAG: efflux RND transporter periplasmic adaptor subunit [Shewanella sp.]|nr:efflux RND transporter periplasmic adaptor subunit [Shewanella sp.]